jgi:hypothetical protein
MNSMTDWDAWHGAYGDPNSPLSERLRVVQQHIDEWLDATAPAAVTVMSSCAGDGRDLLQVLQGRTDADRVRATLLEADPSIADRATEQVSRLGLSNIEVRCTDAGISTAYAGAVPADLVLLCGIFGNVSDEDVRRTIAAASQLCNAGARVIWTRHRRDPDLTPQIRDWFSEHDFAEASFAAPEHAMYSVGVHRFRGDPKPLDPDRRLFTFTEVSVRG